jgi:peptide/nickel transport system permease protein
MTDIAIDKPNAATLARGRRLTRITSRQGFWSIVLGGSVVLGFVLMGLFATLIAPHDPQAQVLAARLLPPAWSDGGSAEHLFGTDALGRDVFSRVVYGTRVSLVVGLAVILGSGLIGVTLGVISGYVGGRTDYLIQKVVELFQAFPFLLLAIAIMAALGPGLGNLILVLVIMRWIQFCRVVRSEVLSVKNREYVTAARAGGVRSIAIAWRHILPHTMASAIVVATFSLATAIISESSLSFLGLGVPPSIPTWGIMLSEGRDYMYSAPWTTVIPGAAIFLFVIAVNIVGDGVRDWTDPKLRRSS